MLNSTARQTQEFVLGAQVDEEEAEGIEVALVRDEGQSRLEVRLTRWGPGVGWYVEKRIPLSPVQSKMVRQSLGRGEALAKSLSGTDIAVASTTTHRGGASSRLYPETA